MRYHFIATSHIIVHWLFGHEPESLDTRSSRGLEACWMRRTGSQPNMGRSHQLAHKFKFLIRTLEISSPPQTRSIHPRSPDSAMGQMVSSRLRTRQRIVKYRLGKHRGVVTLPRPSQDGLADRRRHGAPRADYHRPAHKPAPRRKTLIEPSPTRRCRRSWKQRCARPGGRSPCRRRRPQRPQQQPRAARSKHPSSARAQTQINAGEKPF